MDDPDFLSDYRAAIERSELLAAQVLNLDEDRKMVRSRLVRDFDGPIQRAEHVAQASDAYAAVCLELALTREDAARAKAEALWCQARLDVWRTRASTARARMVRER